MYAELNATANCKHAYTAESRRILGDVRIPDALLCKHVNCSNPDHVAAIDDFYHSINRSLIASSADTIRSRQYACRKRHKAVPGWNDTVKNAHGVQALTLSNLDHWPRGPVDLRSHWPRGQ